MTKKIIGYSPAIKEDLPPVDIEKLLKEKGYNSEERRSLVGKDILFFSDPKAKSSENEELLTLETVIIKKILANDMKTLEIEFPLDKKREHRYLELLAAEIYIGLIVFLTVTAWEISKGIIANYIYDKYKGMKKESKTLHAKVEIQIIDKKKGRTCHLKYSGPANEVSEIIKKTEFK